MPSVPALDGSPSVAGERDRRAAAVGRAADEWRALGLSLQAVRPIRLARYLLNAVVITLIAWFAWLARDALVPIWVGMILAWLLLPLVGWLARRMPRWAAALGRPRCAGACGLGGADCGLDTAE